MNQLSLDLDTKRNAYDSIKPIAGELRKQVFAFIESCGERGATAHEAVAATGISLQSITGRINELTKQGWLFDSGRRRPTPSGRPAKVHIARGVTCSS